MNIAKKFRPCSMVACTVWLAACGGAELGPSDKYVGLWVSGCNAAGLYSAAYPEEELKAVHQLSFSRRHDDSLRFVMVQKIYPAAGCSGLPLAIHVNESSRNTYEIHGSKRIGGTEVDLVTITMGALGGEPGTEGVIVRDGIRYPGDFFISRVDNEKDVVAIDDRELRFGTGEAVDAEGYPVALEPSPGMTKR